MEQQRHGRTGIGGKILYGVWIEGKGVKGRGQENYRLSHRPGARRDPDGGRRRASSAEGDVSEPITKADAHMETIVCPFIRNVFDAALKGKFDYLDGMVMPHQCDSTDKTNNEWRYNLGLPYWHFLNVPHLTDDPSVDFFKSVLGVFIKSLEKIHRQ